MHDQGDDPLIERIAAELRAPRPLRADFDARVMAHVRATPPGPVRSLLDWLAEPRTVAVSPLGGLALAAGVAGLVFVGAWAATQRISGAQSLADAAQAAPVAGAAGEARPITFMLVAPGARQVALAGDFNGWDASGTPLVRGAAGGEGGLWTIDVPLRPGRYNYAFVVDGRTFVADPAAPRAGGGGAAGTDDDFGTPTSVVTVVGSSSTGAGGRGGSL